MATPRRHFYCFGSFRLSETEGVLRRDGEAVTLGPKAVETLLVLIRNRQRVVSREELMKAIWPDSVVEENNLDQQIAALRRTLGQGKNSQVYIETVPRRGYRFLPEVTEEWEKPGWTIGTRLWLMIAAGLIVLVGAGWLIRSRTGVEPVPGLTTKYRQSVAVLGFKNLSGGEESGLAVHGPHGNAQG